MKRILSALFIISIALLQTAAAHAAQTAEIKLKDGSKWRGQVSDVVEVRFLEQRVEITLQGKLTKNDSLFIQMEADLAGKITPKTIFKADIVSMKTISAGDGTVSAPTSADQSKDAGAGSGSAAKPGEKSIGVFVLPLEGFVGGPFRHEEIDKMGEYMDKNYGPGQILILLINSNGGSSVESQKIAQSIRRIEKNHRVIAWIHKAISAGCQTAMCCPEIYFMTEGTAGSVTTWNMGTKRSIKGEELLAAMEDLARIAIESGYSKYVAYSMKTNKAMCSYDKDPVTGDITWYGDLSGHYKLSDDNSNLCFNASNALHCKFSKGTADTTDDLAKVLDMPKWNELSDYGRKLAKDWQRTCEQAEHDIPLLIERLGYKNMSQGAEVVIGTHIGILQDLIGWLDRCPNVAEGMLPPKDRLERQIAELRKELADIKRERTGR